MTIQMRRIIPINMHPLKINPYSFDINMSLDNHRGGTPIGTYLTSP